MLGLVTSVFMAASMVTRPFAGRYSDERGPLPFMLVGSLLFTLFSVLLLVLKLPWLVLVLRAGQGVGFALFYTASASLLTRIVPRTRRAEGISHHSNAVKLAIALAPMAGLAFAEAGQFALLFITVTGVASLATILIVLLKRRIKERDDAEQLLAPKLGERSRLFCKEAVFPGLIISSNSLVFGTLMPFAPLLASQNGVPSPQWFYLTYAIALIASRWGSGPLSDKFGRAAVIIPGMLLVIASLIILSLSSTMWPFLLGSALYGFGAGVVQPSLIAMVADRTDERSRGSAMATFTLFTDGGLATGSLLMGAMGGWLSYSAGLWAAAILCGVGLTLYITKLTLSRRPMVGLGWLAAL